MSLSDTACKNAHRHEKANKGKPFKLTDEKGLYLLLKPQVDGWGKWWRFKYRFGGKEKGLSFGTYPDTTLLQARGKRDDARKLLAEGIDPGEIRKEKNTAKQITAENQNRLNAGLPVLNSFEHVTRDWLASVAHLVRDITQQKKIKRFEQYVFPDIGSMAISEINSPHIQSLIKPIVAQNKLETAHRVRGDIACVFSYAIAHGLAINDPAQAIAKQIPAQNVKHHAAIIDPKDVAQLLRDIFNYQGTFVVQCALKLSPFLFQRPGEIRQMEWKGYTPGH